MSEVHNEVHNDDHAVIEAGYKPQLKRSLGPFASFAIPFSVISITTGIFANYSFVLNKAGPFGFWMWPLVSFGLFFVALTFAEMSARMPLTGSVYNWNNRLVGPFIGWMAGWLAACNYTIGIAAVTTTMLPVLGVILGCDITPHAGALISSGFIILQMLINMCGVRLTSYANVVAVIAEIISIVVLSFLVVIAVMQHGHFNFALLTTIPDNPRPYLPAFLMSSLIAAWCLIGFETSADVSEETINARKVSPRGIIFSLLGSAIIGFAFIVIMTLAIPNPDDINKAPSPLAAIASYYLGNRTTNIFLVFSLIAMFSCSMVCMTAASRVLFAMSRDRRFVAASRFGIISSRHVPVGLILLVTIIGSAFTFMEDPTALYGASTVCAALYYFITVVGFGFKAECLPKMPGTFSLGRWHWPVVILGAIWMMAEICILTIPNEFRSITVATGCVIVVGLILYTFVGRVSKPSRATSPRQ